MLGLGTGALGRQADLDRHLDDVRLLRQPLLDLAAPGPTRTWPGNTPCSSRSDTIGLGIGLGCLGISHYWLGSIWPALQSRLADNISAQIVGTAAGTLFRFWSYRRFVSATAILT